MLNFPYHPLNNLIAKKANFLACRLVFFFIGLLFVSTSSGQQIRIIPENLKKEKGGTILLCLFQTEKGFPEDGSAAFRTLQLKVSEPLLLSDIPPGVYAIGLLHDLDGNGKMTYSFLGFPKDGFSSSPDGGPAFSKPVFAKARFRHGQGETLLRMKIHYLL